MESRQLLASDLPLGVTPVDTGEFLLGTVTVTPVFFESNGTIDPETQDWTESEIDETLLKIRESVDWWSDLLATKTSVHTLDFVIDEQYARAPVETGYEPIDNSSNTFNSYVGGWLTDLGYGDAPSIERAVSLFNDSQRRVHQTDWAFTIFVVDSSDDGDGFFASGGFIGAFAYPGGLFIVVPSGRPASTYTHEMGHIFWARDEYPGAGSWVDRRGYYNAQNLNASDNPTPGFVQQDSIMRGGVAAIRAYDNLVTAAPTLAMIGWQDSDGDGIFDVADVPILLDAIGSYNIDTRVYSFRGSAHVDTLANQNSGGLQSDITLARISHLQYQIDGGAWQNALSPDATQVDFNLQINIGSHASTIAWRAIDTSTGITSPALAGAIESPLFSGVGGGLAYLDRNANGLRDLGEPLIAGTQFTVRRGDGSNLFHLNLQAADIPDGEVSPPNGVSLTSLGDRTDGRVSSLISTTGTQYGRVFHSFDTLLSRWTDRWSTKRKLEVAVPETTGIVDIDFVALDTGTYGLDSGSYARVEAYDASGNQIDRVTSDLVLAGTHGRLVVQDSLGRIAKVVIYGHAETEILISSIEFGQTSIESVNDKGVFSVNGLADGEYSVQLTSPNLTYQLPAQPVVFQITGGSAAPIHVAAELVDSPRHNVSMPGDVNGDQRVTVRDALVIINDLGLFGNRVLGTHETNGFMVDVNNDGRVSAIDALRVINLLEQLPEGEGEATEGKPAISAQTTLPAVTTRPSLSAVSTVAPSAWAVDAVFGPEKPENPLDWDISQIPEKPEMLNSAGQRTSDQSTTSRRSDRPSGADVQLTGENGVNAGLERPLLGFLISNGGN